MTTCLSWFTNTHLSDSVTRYRPPALLDLGYVDPHEIAICTHTYA